MGRVPEVNLVRMDVTYSWRNHVLKKCILPLVTLLFFLYLEKEEKDIENPKDFPEEKEYYEAGEKTVQWSSSRKADTRYMY